jgi:hypothetical protein
MAAPVTALSSPDMDHAITVLCGRMDELFRIIERLDTKAQQAFALGSAFYAGAQALAFASFAEDDVTTPERVLVLVAAAVSTIALLVLAHRLANNLSLRRESGFSPEAIEDWYGDAVGRPGFMSANIVGLLVAVTKRREESARERANTYDSIETAARVAVILGIAESMIALTIRM